jgi:hypothetical protein
MKHQREAHRFLIYFVGLFAFDLAITKLGVWGFDFSPGSALNVFINLALASGLVLYDLHFGSLGEEDE